ncbi:MAG: hypothetical protein OEY01_08250 [Desulfobulbaceae bacterium]|nr:hypothetical protein [Desulfobulbaceae bacterium]HIJ78994.1 cytochrome C [Deltaproteobacteria bacterium]
MTTKRLNRFACLLGVGLLMAATIFAGNALAEGLLPTDCIKCHDKQPKDIASNGLSHKTEISCVDCHEAHRPSSPNNIPQCNKCHEGTAHFDLTGCLNCHNNPHTPKVISIDKDLTEPCLTCHTDQMAQLQQYESSHTRVACSTCHRERHPFIPDCLHCHSPHKEGMDMKVCLTCHKPHMPLEVTYPAETPSEYCAACHDDVYSTLKASKFKHGKFECAKCHQDKHKTIPRCQDCHGENPHPPAMHEKFPQCGQCHGIAHDLNK